MRVAVVLAGGSGQRSGTDTNKVLAPLDGVPVVRRSVDAMFAGGAEAVVVVVRPADRSEVEAALVGRTVTVVAGGATRQRSEAAGIAAAAELGARTAADVIAVHDAARPLVTPALVAGVFAAAANGSAIPALDHVDLWHVDARLHLVRPAPSPLHAAQTPQAVRADLLLDAVAWAGDDAADAPDTVDVVRRFGTERPPLILVPGEHTNLKVTWPADFAAAEAIIAQAVESPIVQSETPPDDDYAALAQVEAQVADTTIALDCLATEGTAICATCQAAEADGTLAERPALARCVAAKRA